MYILDCRQLQLHSLTATKSTQAALISSLEQQDRVGTRVLAGLKAASAGKAADIELLRAQQQTAQLQLQGTTQTVAGLHEQLQAASEASQQQQQQGQRRVADLEAKLHASCEAAKLPSEQLAVLECSNARLADRVAQLQQQLCKGSEAATRTARDLELQVQAAKKAEVEARQQLQLVQQQVERLESSQHTCTQKEQPAQDAAAKLVGEVQQLRRQVAALEGEQREAHKLRGQLAALKGEQCEAQGRAGKQLEDAHSTIKRLTQEVHQG